MCLNVPVGVNILGVIVFVTSDFDLLETPLRQVDVASSEVAAQDRVPKSESSCQSPDLRSVIGCNILDNFNGPVILLITDSSISVT